MKYVGSKNRLSKQLAPIIQSYIDNMGEKCNGYFEPFVGGANMIDKINCSHKCGTDIHKYLIALLRHVQSGTYDLPDTISEEEYKAVKDNKDKYPDWYVGLVGFCSFGAKWFGGYPRDHRGRDVTNEYLRNLKKQAPNLKDIEFRCRCFLDFSTDVKNFVIYCDPPYKGTTKYATSEFPYDKFYQWCKDMSKSNVVLVSEYDIPEDGFECIWQGKVKCLLDKKTDKTEKLFICKG